MRASMGLKLPRGNRWRVFFAAFVVSEAGSEFTRVALVAKGYFVGGGSITGAAAVALAQAAPVVFVAPLSGRLADLGHGKRLAILADIGRLVVLISIAFAGTQALVLIAAATASLLGAVFRPAEARWESWLLRSDDELLAGGVARAAVQSTLSVLGPALAGLAVGVFGIRTALLLDAGTFGASAMLLTMVPAARLESCSEELGFFVGIGRTVSRVLHSFELRSLFGIYGAVILITSMQGPLLFVFFVEDGGSAGRFGLAMAFLGVGSVVGAVMINRRPSIIGDGPRALVSVLVIDSVALGVLSVSSALWLACIPMVFMGLIGSIFGVVVRYTIQADTNQQSAGALFGLLEALESPLAAASLLILSLVLVSFEPSRILLGSAVVEFSLGVVMVAVLLLRASRPRAGQSV